MYYLFIDFVSLVHYDKKDICLQLACPSLTSGPEEGELLLLLISTQRSAYLVNISNEIAATNPAGINAPPETHLLPITPANTAATSSERWKFDGFWEV